MKGPMNLQATNALAHEHQTLVTQYGEVQNRCSALIAAQAAEINRLQNEAVRLRAAAVVRETALAWEREDRQAVEAAIPGLPKRLNLARRVETLMARVQELMRERLGWQKHRPPVLAQATAGLSGGLMGLVVSATEPGAVYGDLREKSVLCVGEDIPGTTVAQHVVEMAGGHFLHHGGDIEEDDEEASLLEASLVAADLVICQTGCVSHNAYWRVQDHCRRTGKQCVLVDQPQAMQFVRGSGFVDSRAPTTHAEEHTAG